MTRLRQQKIANIQVPDLEVEGDADDADLLIVGFGSTYGHLHAAMDELRAAGHKVAQAHFKYLNPLPKNTAEVLMKYKKVVVAEQNMGQLAAYLRMKVGRLPAHEGRPLHARTVQPGQGTTLRGRRTRQGIHRDYQQIII